MESQEHRSVTNVIDKLATEFGVHTTEYDKNYWDTVATVTSAFYDMLDIDHITDLLPYLDKASKGQSVPYLSTNDAEKFAAVYSTLTPERKMRFRRACKLSDFAVRRSQTTTPESYIECILDESHLYSDLAKIDERGKDSLERQRFNNWLPSFIRSGYMLDTLIDIRSDFKNGLTGVRPSLRSYAVISRATYNETVACISQAPAKVPFIMGTYALGWSFKKMIQ